jgi:hypothetical protein
MLLISRGGWSFGDTFHIFLLSNVFLILARDSDRNAQDGKWRKNALTGGAMNILASDWLTGSAIIRADEPRSEGKKR